MKKNGKVLSIIVLIIGLILGIFLAYGYYQKATYKLQRPVISMEIENYGTIKIELYPDMAPNTVKNFIKLINDGYYIGRTFNRVEDVLIQGGYPKEETEETSLCINGEFTENGYDNTLKFERGTVGIARADYTQFSSVDASIVEEGYNSGYDQFFITTQEIAQFNGYYTAFGKVIEGMEIVDTITTIETKVETNEETGETTETTTPVNAPVISNVIVDTFGVEYGEPETHEAFDINSWFMSQYYGLSY